MIALSSHPVPLDAIKERQYKTEPAVCAVLESIRSEEAVTLQLLTRNALRCFPTLPALERTALAMRAMELYHERQRAAEPATAPESPTEPSPPPATAARMALDWPGPVEEPAVGGVNFSPPTPPENAECPPPGAGGPEGGTVPAPELPSGAAALRVELVPGTGRVRIVLDCEVDAASAWRIAASIGDHLAAASRGGAA